LLNLKRPICFAYYFFNYSALDRASKTAFFISESVFGTIFSGACSVEEPPGLSAETHGFACHKAIFAL